MREPLRDVDVNLLVALHALLEERNLTHAGARLTLSQPAMSGALGRLRKHFGDELLVRQGRDFVLTPFAQNLQPVVAAAIDSVDSLIGSNREFEPAGARRRFKVGMSEYAMTVLAQPLVRALTEASPGSSIEFDTLDASADQLEAQLLRRDLLVGPLGYELPGSRQPVFTDHLVCVVARNHPRLVDGALSLEDLATLGHVVAEFRVAQATGHVRPLERALAGAGLPDRHVAVEVTSLVTVPFAVASTELVAFVPRRLASRCLDMLDLVVASTPLPAVEITEAAHWHSRRSDDPAVRWLRELLYDVAIAVESDD